LSNFAEETFDNSSKEKERRDRPKIFKVARRDKLRGRGVKSSGQNHVASEPRLKVTFKFGGKK